MRVNLKTPGRLTEYSTAKDLHKYILQVTSKRDRFVKTVKFSLTMPLQQEARALIAAIARSAELRDFPVMRERRAEAILDALSTLTVISALLETAHEQGRLKTNQLEYAVKIMVKIEDNLKTDLQITLSKVKCRQGRD